MNPQELFPLIEELQIQDDFCDFLQYISEHEVKITKVGNIGPKDCFLINQKLYHSKSVQHNKVQHPKYPAVWFFYHIGLVSKILQYNQQKSKVLLEIDEEQYTAFTNLNKTEKYFFILYQFWANCLIEDLKEDDYNVGLDEDLHEAISEILEESKQDIDEKMYQHHLFGKLGQLIEQLSFLGWWDVILPNDDKDKRWKRNVAMLPLGQFFIPILCEERPLLFWNKHARLNESYRYETFSFFRAESDDIDEEDVKTQLNRVANESFFDVFNGVYEMDNLYAFEIINKPVKGDYIFKASLSAQIWRRIKINGHLSLEDLHLMIQRAFNFSNDHLYAFFTSGKAFKGSSYNDPRGGDPPFADEVAIQELALSKGSKMLYLFDFGDCWEFEVLLEDINEKDDKTIALPSIIEKKGKAPKQYGYYE